MPTLDLKIMEEREFRKNEDFKIQQINEGRILRENRLIEEILKKSPHVLMGILGEGEMLKYLLTYGQCIRTIPYGKYGGLGTAAEVKAAFKKLQKVVGSLLKVSFESDSKRIKVRLDFLE